MREGRQINAFTPFVAKAAGSARPRGCTGATRSAVGVHATLDSIASQGLTLLPTFNSGEDRMRLSRSEETSQVPPELISSAKESPGMPVAHAAPAGGPAVA